MRRGRLWAWLGLAGLAAGMGLLPGFAAVWSARLSRPALRLLNRATALLPFSAMPLLPLAPLCRWSTRRVRKGPSFRLRRGGLLPRLALLLAAGWVALWLPGSLAPVQAYPEPDADALETLCLRLIDALNASELAFPPVSESLADAPAVAGLPGGRVKAALLPGIMRGLQVAGVALPWTGEAIVDATAEPALVPFTAAHELMHIAGISDEGAANLRAWERCLDAGGSFADSARLWALRYAAGLLAGLDEPRAAGILTAMSPALASLWPRLGGVLPPGRGFVGQGRYHDLVRGIAAGYVG